MVEVCAVETVPENGRIAPTVLNRYSLGVGVSPSGARIMPCHLWPSMNRRTFMKVNAMGTAMLAVGDAAAFDGAHGLNLALISDTHIPADRLPGARGYDAGKQLLEAVPGVLAAQPDALIVTGDLARHVGTVEDYSVFLELIEPIRDTMPVYLMLGNHDNRENFYTAIANLPGKVKSVEEKHVSVLEHAHVRIVLLDSLLYTRQRGGHFGKEQRDWLSGYLSKHGDRPVILMLHHTLGDGDNDLLDTENFFQLLAPHPQVRAIFHGHAHSWRRYERAGIPIVSLPTTAHIRSAEDPIGWVDARFTRDGMTLTLRTVGGNEADNGKSCSYTWD